MEQAVGRMHHEPQNPGLIELMKASCATYTSRDRVYCTASTSVIKTVKHSTVSTLPRLQVQRISAGECTLLDKFCADEARTVHTPAVSSTSQLSAAVGIAT